MRMSRNLTQMRSKRYLVAEGAIIAPRRMSRGGKPVAGTADRLYQPVVGRGFQRFAQPPDVHVNGALLDEHVIAPNLVEQLGARIHALRVRHEEMQEPKFRGP